jgi:RNA polymerase sigma factor (sigma-70 family)
MQSTEERPTGAELAPGSPRDIPNSGAVCELPAEHIKWAHAIARSIHRKIPGSFDLEDLQQIALLKTWQKWQTWDPAKNDKFQGYAYLAVSGQVKMSLRRQSWFEHSNMIGETHFESGLGEMMKTFDTPESQLVERETATETKELLRTALESLPPIERFIIRALFFEGLTLKQIVCEVGVQFPLVIPRPMQKQVAELRDRAIARMREIHGISDSVVLPVKAKPRRARNVAAAPAMRRDDVDSGCQAPNEVAHPNLGRGLADGAHQVIGRTIMLGDDATAAGAALSRLGVAARLAEDTLSAGMVARDGGSVTSAATWKRKQRKTINVTYELWHEINVEAAIHDEGACEAVQRVWDLYKRENQGLPDPMRPGCEVFGMSDQRGVSL